MNRTLALGGFLLLFAVPAPETAPLGAPAALRAQIPATESPVRFNIDPAHSSVLFTVRHMGLSRVRGTFSTVSGTLMWDPEEPTRSSLTMVVRTESLSTANTRRDQDLRENYFEVDEYPVALFRSNGVDTDADGDLLVEGDLTIRDVTERVRIEVESLGTWNDPNSRSERVGFAGSLEIDRNTFGVTNPGSAAEINLVISDQVDLQLELEGVRNDPAGVSFASGDAPSIGERLSEPLSTGDLETAQELFDELRSSPDSVNLGEREFLVLTVQLLWDDHFEASAASARMGLEVHPESTTLRTLLGEALWRSGEPDEAREVLAAVLEDQPNNTTALELLRHLDR